MKVVELHQEHKDKLNDFVRSHKYGTLLQSWQWGELWERLRHKIFRLGVLDDKDNLVASALLIKHNLPFEKSYLYCPKGPIIKNSEFKVESSKLKILLDEINKIAKKENSIFLCIDPVFNLINLEIGFKPSCKQIQPIHDWVLNIDLSEEELLKKMKQKTRYNIRLAERKGVKILESTEETEERDIEEFYKITSETEKRQGFCLHPKEHFVNLIKILQRDDLGSLFMAEHNGKAIAGAVVSFFGTEANYLHGASSYEFRNIMAPHLLHWEIIKKAKKKGCSIYNFGGIAPDDNPKRKWAGITRFKKGFGGRKISHIPAHDLVYKPFLYNVFKILKTLKHLI